MKILKLIFLNQEKEYILFQRTLILIINFLLLFITYNPYNKDSKILSPILFNKCISFILTNLYFDKMDVVLILYKLMKIHYNKNL